MASFAAAKQSLQAAAKVELHQRTQAAKRLARESAERLAKAAGAWAERLSGQEMARGRTLARVRRQRTVW